MHAKDVRGREDGTAMKLPELGFTFIYLLREPCVLFMGEIPPQPIRPRVPVCSLKFPCEVFNSGNLGGRLIISRAEQRTE